MTDAAHWRASGVSTGQSDTRCGFSLVEISIVLAVLSVILAGLLPVLVEQTRADAARITLDRLDAIEEALAAYVIEQGRLPCPADGTATLSDPGFGKQAEPPGLCGRKIATRFSSGGDDPIKRDGLRANFLNRKEEIAGGVVPTRTLGLPDEMGFDGWGRRFSYHVTLPATKALASGAIRIGDGQHQDNDNARTREALYVLLSHGPNGHGAFMPGGVRYEAGAEHPFEHENCDCDAGAAKTGYDARFIQSIALPGGTPAQGFDDILRWKELTHLRAQQERDPSIGEIEEGRWCQGESGKVVCTQPPVGVLSCTTESASAPGNAASVFCPPQTIVTGGGGSCAGAMIESIPQGGGWAVTCSAAPSSAYVRCCRK